MKKLLLLTIVLAISCANQQIENSYYQRIKKHRMDLNKEFSGEKSPLTAEDRKTFVSLNFYPVDSNYRIWADLKLTPNAKPFVMQTSTERLVNYTTYGYATFLLHGKKQKLAIYYQSESEQPHLFLPFGDETSGFETYGGGRYLDIDSVKENKVLIDFNLAYNPYCAYNHKYSCPIPPKENLMKIKIEAGEKNYH